MIIYIEKYKKYKLKKNLNNCHIEYGFIFMVTLFEIYIYIYIYLNIIYTLMLIVYIIWMIFYIR